ncbi:MAG: cupredoxin domain-containing protein [Chloroflexota bacterium]|nr:cupredoxin domain-containing protein [Chloroflexota bacterium]
MRIKFLVPTLLIGLVACSSAESSPPVSDAPASEAPAAEALAVSVADFMLDPSELEVTGSTVTIDVTNDGPTPHNLTVRDEAGEVVMATEDLSVGAMETITAELEPGEYTTFCSLAGHESLGMVGTLTVSGS